VSYSIIDEPEPSRLEQLVVDPKWPLFAFMFAGAWLALPWYVVNSFALGRANRVSDAAIAAGGFIVNVATGLLLAKLPADLAITERSYVYLQLLPVAIKLVTAYVLYTRQSVTFELFEYFGGKAKSGLLIVIAGSFLRAGVLAAIPAALRPFFV